MRVILCDRCGARIERKDTVGFVGLTRKDINTGDLIGKTDFEDWDICDDCMQQIEDFVRLRPSSAEEEPPRPKATIKKHMTPKTSPEQIEQIKQMARENKPVMVIAGTVGVSMPTVRKYIKEMQDDSVHESDEG